MENNTKEFIHKHNIRILDTNKRAHKVTRLSTEFFNVSNDYNVFHQNPIVFDTEPLYTVEISESELTRIAEFESQVFNHLHQHGHYNMFEVMMEQKERERYLKEKFPAVKKAYEHYSLLLKMAEGGEL